MLAPAAYGYGCQSTHSTKALPSANGDRQCPSLWHPDPRRDTRKKKLGSESTFDSLRTQPRQKLKKSTLIPDFLTRKTQAQRKMYRPLFSFS